MPLLHGYGAMASVVTRSIFGIYLFLPSRAMLLFILFVRQEEYWKSLCNAIDCGKKGSKIEWKIILWRSTRVPLEQWLPFLLHSPPISLSLSLSYTHTKCVKM